MNQQQQVLRLLDRLHDVPKDQQAAFLDDACRDNLELRREVESMLAIKNDAIDLFETNDHDQIRTDFPSTKSEAHSGLNLRLQTGQLLSDRYEVLATLGHGGMGEVYRAKDLRLGREVALKILNLAARRSDQMLERFERELKSVAALSHANVVTLHDVVNDGEITFAVMELIEGATLREIVKTSVPIDTAMRIARDVAAGLSAAHQRNIMHRDIKPENIMVTADGVAKVLDFGIARTEAHDEQVTLISAAGMIPGTPPYMSPEQAEGNELGCSTDIFSFGTVLFEMLTGVNPFQGKSLMITLQKVCQAERPRVGDYQSNVPLELAELVESMLLVDSGQRPSIDQVQSRLRDPISSPGGRVATSTPGRVVRVTTARSNDDRISDNRRSNVESLVGGRPSIAILPLSPISEDPKNATFGDAIAHEVMVELSKLHSLMVISRGSSFQFRGSEVDLAEIGRVLAVKYVATGTIDLQGSQCRVSVELARTDQNSILWADRFETAIDDVLRLRDEISSQIVSAIESQVQLAESHEAMRLPTENLDAWSAYHRGLWHMYRFNAHDNQVAGNLFRQAIEMDRNFARAHAGLSFTHFQQAFLKYSDQIEQERQRTRATAETALRLDPSDPFVNLTMGRSEWLAGNIEGAGDWMDQSLRLSPSNAFATYNRGLVEAMLNHGQQSQVFIEKALALSPIDPLSYAMHCTLAFSHLVRGHYQDAIQCTERAVRMPTAHIHIFLAAALANELGGDQASANRFAERVRQIDSAYTQADFLRVFPFRDAATVQRFADSLSRLGI